MISTDTQELALIQNTLRRFITEEVVPLQHEHGLDAEQVPPEMVNRTAFEAVQIHGGAGCLRETGIERVYRMVRVLTILEGTSEMQRLTIARRLLKETG